MYIKYMQRTWSEQQEKKSYVSSFHDLYSMTHHWPYCNLYQLLSYHLITRLGHCNQNIISMVTDLCIYGQRQSEYNPLPILLKVYLVFR